LYCTLIKLGGSIHHATLNSVKCCFADVLQDEQEDVELNCSSLMYIDAAFIGSLVLFQCYLNEQRRQLYLQNVPKHILRILDLNNVLGCFQLEVG
jgi:anti-anti-sigma regulatory factor